MLLIGGVRPHREVMATMTLVCGRCRNASGHRLTQEVNRVTVFFVPTVKVSTKYDVECLFCGGRSPMNEANATQLAKRAKEVPPGTVLGTVQPGATAK